MGIFINKHPAVKSEFKFQVYLLIISDFILKGPFDPNLDFKTTIQTCSWHEAWLLTLSGNLLFLQNRNHD